MEYEKVPQFQAFWKASILGQHNLQEFSAGQERFNANEKSASLLEYPPKPQRLAMPRTLANHLAKRRNSQRTFTGKSLTKRELGTLLSSFAAYGGLERRSYPSAGASYAVETFCVALRVAGFNRKLLYYNADLHAVSVLDDAPPWDALAPNINVSVNGIPQCIVIFAVFPERLTEKYGERGGRFALIEVGAAMQQLAIQIAGSRTLKGVAAGGMLDDYWSSLLGFKSAEVQIALGYLCGR